MGSRITIAGVLLALVLASATGAGAGSPARVTATRMVQELQQRHWRDGRIVPGAQCVGDGGVVRGTKPEFYSTRFVCLVQAWHKPASTSPALWSRLETAFETGNVAAIYRLLGLPLTASKAQVEAVSNRILGRATPSAVGARAIDAAHLKLEPTRIPTSWFMRALTARHGMLELVIGVEAWYYDHNNTYVGATAARLRAAPYNMRLPSNVRVVRTLANSYCLEASVGATTWADRGPGGVPALARCA